MNTPSANTEPASANPGKKRFFYGWVIVASAFLLVSTLGEGVYSFGVYFKPLENEFGWSRATTSSAYTIFLLAFGASGFYLGRLADRRGPRLILILAGITCGLGFIMARWTHEIWQLWIFMGLAGIGAGPAYSVPVATVQRWFIKKRGQAVGMVIAGTGTGAVVFVMLTNLFVDAWGWRAAYTMMGAIVLVISLIAAPFLIESPAKMGLKPYGADEETAKGSSKKEAEPIPLGAVIRTRPFIVLCIILMGGQITSQITNTHLVPFATDIGIERLLAASAIGLIAAFSVPGRLSVGLLCDRIGWTKAMGILYLAQAAVVMILFAVHSYGVLLIFVVMYGSFHGGRIVTQGGIVAHLFGTKHLGALTGLTMGISLLAGAAGPYIAGLIYDQTQSYFLAFALMAILLAAAGGAAFLLKPPKTASVPSTNDG